MENEEKMSFNQFPFCKEIANAIKEAGFETPTPIQAAVIPHIIEGRDVIAKAQTGSGKTAAFALPSLHLLAQSEEQMMLVITPTRELAMQVSEEIKRFSKLLKIFPTTIYGGAAISNQIAELRRNHRIVVGTPGRLLDMFKSGHMKKFRPSLVVLDEADEMLNMGFIEDVQEILSFLEKEGRQTLLFSATISDEIRKIAKKFLKDPIFTDQSSSQVAHADIEQRYYLVPEKQRREAIRQLLYFYHPQKAIIFCNTKKQVMELAEDLLLSGIHILTLHGDMTQKDRQHSIESFRKSPSKILVATDVAGRGINVTDVTHVFNYDLPFSVESHTHRIGRTGRMGNKGMAISLIAPKQKYLLQNFAKTKLANISLLDLPSQEEMHKVQGNRFSKSLKDELIHTEAEKILAQLREEFDLKEITLKLISKQLKKEVSTQKIVASPKEEPYKKQKGNFSKNRKRRFFR